MTEMSRRFNFDDFDEQIREALEDNDSLMENLVPFRRPGEIGSVAITHRFQYPTVTEIPRPDPDTNSLPEPPEAA